MTSQQTPHFGWMAGSLAIALAFLSSAITAHANVYATDIQINGNLTNTLVPNLSPLSISYRLNQVADLGVTVNILSNGTSVATIAGGTNRGLNAVSWTPTTTGTYSVSITAAATGFTNWTQISVDSSPGMPAHFPQGMAVDNNTNSPYYGRVVVGCALNSGTVNVPAVAMKIGLFKNNADGSQADEGWYGNANYLQDDIGNPPVAGQMPAATGSSGYDPRGIRIGEDDRIYWVDSTKVASVISCDMLATQYQVVIAGPGGNLASSPYNYEHEGDISEYVNGFHVMDVAFLDTTNASIWLCDGDYPNPGIWMYHLTNNGVNPVNTVSNVLAADPNDTVGTQVVYPGNDMAVTANGGVMVDTNLDIYCGETRANANAFYDTMVFSNWNAGVLPPENGDFNYATGTAAGQVAWGYNCGVDTTCTTDVTTEDYVDVVINSRLNPTVVAAPTTSTAASPSGGIRLFNAQTGALLVGTNIDAGQAYTSAAFDNVGNLYGASTSRNLWRVWSPPGASTNTTTAVAQAIVQAPFTITGITSTPSTPGCAAVTISFTAPNLGASAFVLKGSPTVKGLYTAVAGASVTGNSGAYTATFTNCSTEYYTIEAYFPGLVQIQNGCFTANASSFKDYPGYINAGPNPSGVSNWTYTGTGSGVGVNGLAVTFTNGTSPFGPTNSTGYTYAFLQGGVRQLSQNLPLSPNTTYTLSFAAAGRRGNNPTFQVQISDASQVYVSTGTLPGNTGAFTQYSYPFTTPAAIAGTPSIQLINVTPTGDNTMCFSEVSLATVAH